MTYHIEIFPIRKIRVTEEHSAAHAEVLRAEIEVSGIWTHPLWVDESHNVLMDGHHRYFAGISMGLKAVPVVILSYDDPAVTIESWRADHSFSPQDIWEIVSTGRLLPMKSTRHLVNSRLPLCQVPLGKLKDTEHIGEIVQPAKPYPNRTEILTEYYRTFCTRMNLRGLSGVHPEFKTNESLVPHNHLRQALTSDPAMAALLPGALCRIALGRQSDFPFRLKSPDLMLLPPSLLECPSALSAAARWGMEAAFAVQTSRVGPRRVSAIVRHGASLIRQLSPSDRALFLENQPAGTFQELVGSKLANPSQQLLDWISNLIGLEIVPCKRDQAPLLPLPLGEPIEDILQSYGDSRLEIDPSTGKTKYGTTPRPRPEAVHFSSSTASSISEYGFLFCDILRRDLLNHYTRKDIHPRKACALLNDAVVSEMRDLCLLSHKEADGVVAPSGTDTEVLAMMLSRAGKPADTLVNILVSPEETGRGVKLAGAGRYFDEESATGNQTVKGAEIWPGTRIELLEVAIRDVDGERLPKNIVDAAFLAAGKEALKNGNRVLAHMLVGSKTGLSGPSEAVITELHEMAPDRVDIVVDACQMRVSFDWLGACVRRGWMIQISGSKALTGPPFSGGLLFPVSMRSRVQALDDLMKLGPSRAEDWSNWWHLRLEPGSTVATFGAAFRWLPAFLEAKLLSHVPEELRLRMLKRFCSEVFDRLEISPSFLILEASTDESVGDDIISGRQFAEHSIISFQVLGRAWDGTQAALDEPSCREIFNLLNRDARGHIPSISRAEQSLLGQEFHIGQPVVIGTGEKTKTMLRLVIGYRFFNIVASAGPGGIAGALESEISDLVRAIDKLEILAENWWRYCETL